MRTIPYQKIRSRWLSLVVGSLLLAGSLAVVVVAHAPEQAHSADHSEVRGDVSPRELEDSVAEVSKWTRSQLPDGGQILVMGAPGGARIVVQHNIEDASLEASFAASSIGKRISDSVEVLFIYEPKTNVKPLPLDTTP